MKAFVLAASLVAIALSGCSDSSAYLSAGYSSQEEAEATMARVVPFCGDKKPDNSRQKCAAIMEVQYNHEKTPRVYLVTAMIANGQLMNDRGDIFTPTASWGMHIVAVEGLDTAQAKWMIEEYKRG
ncbi:MAG: hypothetical protein ABIT47_00245 [Candidatus Paceibacterota bacterium]